MIGYSSMVADTPEQKIALKAFHCEIQNDHQALKREEEAYKPIPVISNVRQELVLNNYNLIREEIKEIIDAEIQKLI